MTDILVASYRDRATGRYPVALDEIRAASSFLFGDVPPSDVLAAVGVDSVSAVEQPTFDPTRQTVTEGQPFFDGQRWVQTWALTDLPPVAPDPFAGFIPVYLLRQRAEKLGIWEELAAYLGQSPALLLKVTTLEGGMIDPAYPDLLKGFDDLGVAGDVRAYLLADTSLGVPDVAGA